MSLLVLNAQNSHYHTSSFSNLSKLYETKQVVFERQGLLHSEENEIYSIDVTLQSALSGIGHRSQGSEANANESLIREVSPHIFELIQSNKSSVYLHVLVMKNELGYLDQIKSGMSRPGGISIPPHHYQVGDLLYGAVKMIKYDFIPKSFQYRYLLADFGLVHQTELEGNHI